MKHHRICNIKFAFHRPNIASLHFFDEHLHKFNVPIKQTNTGIVSFMLFNNENKNVPYFYNVFPSAGIINVTGIVSEDAIQQAISTFDAYLHHLDILESPSHLQDTHIVIHSCTVNGAFNNTFNLSALALNISTSNLINGCMSSTERVRFDVYYDPHRFPGLRIYVRPLGVMLLYASGKYLLVGIRNTSHIDVLFCLCEVFLRQHAVDRVEHNLISPSHKFKLSSI